MLRRHLSNRCLQSLSIPAYVLTCRVIGMASGCMCVEPQAVSARAGYRVYRSPTQGSTPQAARHAPSTSASTHRLTVAPPSRSCRNWRRRAFACGMALTTTAPRPGTAPWYRPTYIYLPTRRNQSLLYPVMYQTKHIISTEHTGIRIRFSCLARIFIYTFANTSRWPWLN